MQKKDVPQDLGALGKITKEISYATDDLGKYVTEQSVGWDVKKTALDAAWGDIEKRIEQAKQKVWNNEASPILYFMEKGLMDVSILAGYTGFAKWRVKRHLKPSVFKKLSDKKLQAYADVFNIKIDELQNFNPA
ncbi:MAG: hypothetical protein PW786_07690 [Arachidicoccus sp.]|nr:hypothetical protein [Arachidicoccus sp.]